MNKDVPLRFVIRRAYQVAIARKQTERFLTTHYRMTDERLEAILLVLTEAATNVVKHAKGGMLSIKEGVIEGKKALVMELDDEGPGIENLSDAQREGFSTSGTLGLGFRIMKQNTDLLKIENTSKGLRITAAWFFGKDLARRPPSSLDYTTYMQPMPGYKDGGDVVFVKQGRDGKLGAAIFDVLGHGVEAYASVVELKKVWELATAGGLVDPQRLLQRAARQLSKGSLRSAVACAGVFDPKERVLTIAGVGNITTVLIIDGRFVMPYFRGGVLGDYTGKRNAQHFQVREELVWAMGSDGLKSGWASECKRHYRLEPKKCAGIILRRYKRTDDDVSLVVVKWSSG